LELSERIDETKDKDAGLRAEPLFLEGDVGEQRQKGLELLAAQSVHLLVCLDQRAAVEARGQPLGPVSGADEHQQFLVVASTLLVEGGRLRRISSQVSLL
jgi:hypothetical protein